MWQSGRASYAGDGSCGVIAAGVAEVGVTRECKRAARRQRKEVRDRFHEELYVAKRRGDVAGVWLLAQALADTSIGPKKRVYTRPVRCRPQLAEWIAAIAKPGAGYTPVHGGDLADYRRLTSEDDAEARAVWLKPAMAGEAAERPRICGMGPASTHPPRGSAMAGAE